MFDKFLFALGVRLQRTGVRMQERVGSFRPGAKNLPDVIFQTVCKRNDGYVRWRKNHPKKTIRPLALVVTCMDPRVDPKLLLGDARGYYDVLRIPGSALTKEIIESVILSVKAHKVKLILIAQHTHCAMEEIAQNPGSNDQRYAGLIHACNKFDELYAYLIEDPDLRALMANAKLRIERCRIDTKTGRFCFRKQQKQIKTSSREEAHAA